MVLFDAFEKILQDASISAAMHIIGLEQTVQGNLLSLVVPESHQSQFGTGKTAAESSFGSVNCDGAVGFRADGIQVEGGMGIVGKPDQHSLIGENIRIRPVNAFGKIFEIRIERVFPGDGGIEGGIKPAGMGISAGLF